MELGPDLRLVGELLLQCVGGGGEHELVHHPPGHVHRLRDVGALVARAAKGLAEIGVGKGVRVGLFLPNCPYYVICYHAVLQAGGTVVNFNPLYAEREIARQISDSGARILVTMDLSSLYKKVKGRLQDT